MTCSKTIPQGSKKKHRRAAKAARLFFILPRAPAKSYTKWQQCSLSVGVDAARSPARCNHKIARIFGENAQRLVGADASVRPWGNGKFAAAYRKNGRAACESMRRPQAGFEAQPRAARLLAPRMGIDPYKRGADSHWCVRVCGCIPPGGQRRPPLRVHPFPHWCTQFCGGVPRGRGRAPPLRLGWRGCDLTWILQSRGFGFYKAAV